MVKIEILGSGCSKCQELAANVVKAADSLGIEYSLEKVTDVNDIITYGVMFTPALAIDGVVKISGKVATSDEIVAILKSCEK